MVALIKFIASISIYLYLVLAVVVVILLRMIQLALRERSQTIFDLERNHATARLNRALFYLLLVILVGGGIFYTSTELIAEVPLPEETPTPTVVAQLPPTPTSPPLLPTPTPTLTATPRPTISTGQLATPPTLTPQAQAGVPPNCPLPGAHITQPRNGAVVSGVVQVIGTANIENFDYYKIEFRVPGGDEWHYINSYATPAGEGPIARWDTSGVPAGEYEFRLVVVDTTGNFPEPCQIRLIVQH